MKPIPEAIEQRLLDHNIVVIQTDSGFWGHASVDGKFFDAYIFRYQRDEYYIHHVAMVRPRAKYFEIERLLTYDDQSDHVYSEVESLGSWEAVEQAILESAAVLRITGEFDKAEQ